MNYRVLSRYLGLFSIALGVLMLPSAAWAVHFREWHSLRALLWASAVSFVLGALLALIGGKPSRSIKQREALGLVGVSWLVVAALGALPYIFAGVFGPVDAYFESMSGFTTTGSTVLPDVEAAPNSILFWRSFTQWLGGMGVVVLFIAVLPFIGAGGKMLFRSETPGPDPHGLQPRIKDTASFLWKIYLGFTAAQTVALMAVGLSFFDALTHTFSTLSTGGFSTRQASVAAFDSVSVELIITAFMVAAGVNFGLYFALLRKRWTAVSKDTEWRIYLLLLSVAIALITINLYKPRGVDGFLTYPALGQALRYSSFQVVSIMTTTGYVTADFDQWPDFARIMLMLLMFIGGSAGSTAGGMKVIRIVVLLKMAYWRLEYTFRPKAVRAIRVAGVVVEEPVQRTIYAFFVLYLAIYALGTLILASFGLPFETAISASAATLNNIGPGLQLVGAVHDYTVIPAAGKVLLSMFMVMGRLELFSILVLLIPSFWRRA